MSSAYFVHNEHNLERCCYYKSERLVDLESNNAAQPESQEEPDIGNLMEIVEESMTAYKVGKSRVEAEQ